MPERPRVTLLLDISTTLELVNTLIVRELRALDVPSDDYGMLTAIALHGPITPTELAWRMGSPPTTVYDAVRRLMGRKHVRRRPNPRDKRSHLLVVTPAGRRVVQEGSEAIRRVVQAILPRLEHPVTELVRSIDDLRQAAEFASRDLT